MTELAHQPRSLYKLMRRVVRAIPLLDSQLMSYVRARRVRRSATVLEVGNFFPESCTEVLADYAYSTARTHRGIMQVINLEAVLRYVEAAGIEGAVVETGTYTGGASAYMLCALKRLRCGKAPREYWGFDSFEGMPAPSQWDGDHGSIWITGKRLANIDSAELGTLKSHEVNRADYDECHSYLCQTGYPSQHIHLVKGWFQDTLKPTKEKIGTIALLRMDGDFYDSTKVVFEQLYDQVVEGGVVIIDDYGSFEGCRRATEEFFAMRRIKAHLVYVENNIRYFVKPATIFS